MEPLTPHELAEKVAVRVRQRREGRLVRGADNMRRELAAAGGDSRHGSTFNYPTGRRPGTLLSSILDGPSSKDPKEPENAPGSSA